MKESLSPVLRNAVLYERAVRPADLCLASNKVILVLSGNLSVKVAGRDGLLCAPGGFLFLPCGISLSLRSKGLRAVILTFDWSDGSQTADPPFSDIIYIEDFASERDAFLQMTDTFSLGTESGIATASALLKLELIRAADTVCENALPVRMASELNAYIREHCTDEISNTEIGAIFGYHPFYVSQMMKKRLGVTLHQYVLRYKIRLACRMLVCTDQSVAEIAERTGFKDSSYFSKTFKTENGMTPKDYRAKFQAESI